MNTHTRPLVFVLAVTALTSTPAAVQDRPALASDRDKVSYALGMDLGRQLRQKNVEVDVAVFGRGLADALGGAAPLMSEQEARRLIGAMQSELQRQDLARAAEDAEKNRRDGDAFLAANKGQPGVVTLASGLQYRVLSPGSGRTPTADDTVTCHYRAKFIDGAEFDSSYSRGKPATFPVKNAIRGWSEALQLMPAGSRWQVFIPADLAYGSRGAGGRIAPNTTLIFEVELVAIN